MRLSFSTRGWQHLSWDELLEAAVDADLEGVEVYDLFKRPDLIQRGGPFDKYNAVTTARTLRDRGLRIPCLDTSCDLSDADSAGIILGLIWYVNKYGKKNDFDFMWLVDHLVIPVSFAACFIRL